MMIIAVHIPYKKIGYVIGTFWISEKRIICTQKNVLYKRNFL